eukprot:211948_1
MDPPSDDEDDDDGNEQLIHEIVSSMTNEVINCLKSTLQNSGTKQNKSTRMMHDIEPNAFPLHEELTVDLELNTENIILSLSQYELNVLRQSLLEEKDNDHHHHVNLTNEENPQMHPLPHTGKHANAINSDPQTLNKRQDIGDQRTSNKHPKNTKNTSMDTDEEHKDPQHSPPRKPSSSPSKSPNKIQQIDEALATYYASVGVHDYFDSNGIGRFSAFIEREAFDVDPSSIEQELGTQSSADNTTYTEFDAHFPFHDDILKLIVDCNIDKANLIFFHFCNFATNTTRRQPMSAYMMNMMQKHHSKQPT